MNDRFFSHVAEAGQLVADAFREVVFGPAHQDIRLYTKLKELFDGVLGGLGFEFTSGLEVGDEGEVDHQSVFGMLPAHLTHSFDVGKRFNVAHCAANFSDHKVVAVAFAQDLDTALDFVCDVRNNLNGAPEVFSAAFFVDDALVNPPRCDVVGL